MTINPTTDMSLVTLLTGASVPVQLVMAILLITSLVSWWYIFIKVFTLKNAERETAEFERVFWTGGDLNQLYEGITTGRRDIKGMASIFEAGFKEYARLKRQSGQDVGNVIEGSRRAMRAAYN